MPRSPKGCVVSWMCVCVWSLAENECLGCRRDAAACVTAVAWYKLTQSKVRWIVARVRRSSNANGRNFAEKPAVLMLAWTLNT